MATTDLQPLVRAALDPDIAGLDLAPACYLAVLHHYWNLDKVRAVELEYRCFLQCMRDFPRDEAAPSRDCDLLWHCHLLHLDAYLRQTTALFGRPLLHFPFSGLMGTADAARQTARFERSQRRVQGLMSRVSDGRRRS